MCNRQPEDDKKIKTLSKDAESMLVNLNIQDSSEIKKEAISIFNRIKEAKLSNHTIFKREAFSILLACKAKGHPITYSEFKTALNVGRDKKLKKLNLGKWYTALNESVLKIDLDSTLSPNDWNLILKRYAPEFELDEQQVEEAFKFYTYLKETYRYIMDGFNIEYALMASIGFIAEGQGPFTKPTIAKMAKLFHITGDTVNKHLKLYKDVYEQYSQTPKL